MNNWVTIPFEDIYAEPSRNGLNRPKRVRGNGYRMVNMGELFACDRIRDLKMDLVPMNEAEKEKYSLKQGDLLFARQSLVAEGAGKCSIILEIPELTTFESHLIRVRLNEFKASPLFYYYYFVSPQGKSNVQSLVMQVAAAGIRASELTRLQIPFPPLHLQRKIASILSAYDDLIENNTRRIKILEEMAQMLYREWFVNFRFPNHENVKMVESELGLIPEGWEVKPITEAMFVSPKTQVPKEGIKPFVPMGCLSNGSMLINNVESRSGNSGSKFKNSDTLFARITPCLENGKTGFVQFLESKHSVAFGSTEFIVLRSKTLCPEYVYLLSRYDSFRDNAIKSMSGATGRQRVREICFNSFMFAHPTPQIIQYFSTVIAPNFSLIYNLNKRNINLRKTRDLLLPKLISGEIDAERLDIETLEIAA